MVGSLLQNYEKRNVPVSRYEVFPLKVSGGIQFGVTIVSRGDNIGRNNASGGLNIFSYPEIKYPPGDSYVLPMTPKVAKFGTMLATHLCYGY